MAAAHTKLIRRMIGDDILKSDRVLIAALIGVFSTLPYEILTRILKFLGYGKYSLYQLDSHIVTVNRINAPIGFLVSCSVSVFISVVFYFLLKAITSQNLVIKSILFSIFAWTTMELMFTSTIEGTYIPIRPMGDYYSHALGAVIFGVAQGLLLKQFLFNK